MKVNATIIAYMCFLQLGCQTDSIIISQEPTIIEYDNFIIKLYDGLSISIIEPMQGKLNANHLRILTDLEVVSMGKVAVSIWSNESF